jgi:hypothetical protein
LLYPFFKIRLNSDFRKILLVITVANLVMLLVSVSELFYLQVWFFAALTWHELYREQRQAEEASCRAAASAADGVAP